MKGEFWINVYAPSDFSLGSYRPVPGNPELGPPMPNKLEATRYLREEGWIRPLYRLHVKLKVPA